MLFRRRFPQAKNEIPLWVSRTLRSERRCVLLRRAPRWRRTPRSRSRRRSAGCRGQGACRWSSTRETGLRAGTSCRTSRTLLALHLLTNGFKVRPQDIKDYEDQFTAVRGCSIIQVLNLVRLCDHYFYTVRSIRILFLYQRTKAIPMRWFNIWRRNGPNYSSNKLLLASPPGIEHVTFRLWGASNRDEPPGRPYYLHRRWCLHSQRYCVNIKIYHYCI